MAVQVFPQTVALRSHWVDLVKYQLKKLSLWCTYSFQCPNGEDKAATCQSCGQHKSVAELRQTEQQLGGLELTQNNKEALQKILVVLHELKQALQFLFCLPQLRNQFVLATRLTSSGLILAIRTLNINQRTSHYGVLILFRVLMARTRPLRVNLAANTNRLRSCGKQNNNWRAYLSSRRTTRRLCRKYWPLIRTCCIQITTF